MQCERFIKEYSNYQIKCLKDMILMDSNIKAEAIETCKRAVAIRERGLITVDEAVGIIKDSVKISCGE